MNDQIGTVDDPFWSYAVTVLFVGLTIFVIAVAVSALVVEFIRRYRKASVELDQTITDGLVEIDCDRWDVEL